MNKKRRALQRKLTGIIACCVLVTFTAVFAKEVANTRKAMEATTTNLEQDVGELFSNTTLDLPKLTPKAKKKTVAATVKKKEEPKYHKPTDGKCTKKFNINELQYDETMQDWRVHTGSDYSGDKVYAVHNATVSEVGSSEMYGKYIIAKFGDYTAKYYNLKDNSTIQKGQKIKKGQVIGSVGNSGAFEVEQGKHLHLEITKKDKPVDLF